MECFGRLDAGSHDGLVNAALQVLDPGELDEVLALVGADHLDVIGFYDRRRPLSPLSAQTHTCSEIERRGWLKSGSSFNDNHLVELWTCIGTFIVERIEGLEQNQRVFSDEEEVFQ